MKIGGETHETGISAIADLRTKAQSKQKRGVTDCERLERHQKINVLKRDVAALLEVRNTYVSAAYGLEQARVTDAQASKETDMWTNRIWLPSDLPADLRISGCAPKLLERELQARTAAAVTSMGQLQTGLRQRQHGLDNMKSQAYGSGQQMVTVV
jgi:hypothetical protein